MNHLHFFRHYVTRRPAAISPSHCGSPAPILPSLYNIVCNYIIALHYINHVQLFPVTNIISCILFSLDTHVNRLQLFTSPIRSIWIRPATQAPTRVLNTGRSSHSYMHRLSLLLKHWRSVIETHEVLVVTCVNCKACMRVIKWLKSLDRVTGRGSSD